MSNTMQHTKLVHVIPQLFLICLGSLGLAGGLGTGSAAAADRTTLPVLTLDAAEQAALRDDPGVERLNSRAKALTDRAVADAQLPDPKLKLAAMNLPTDGFSTSQEPMTQLQAGIIQAFPRGRSLTYRSRRTSQLSLAEQAKAEDLTGKTLLAVRRAYLDVYFQGRAGGIIHDSRHLFRQLVQITEAHYASGRQSQQDVANAQLELSLLDDRAVRIREKEQVARAELAKWVGEQAWQPVTKAIPSLPPVPDKAEILHDLQEHPAIRTEDAKTEAARQGVKVALEQYKPGVTLDLTYGSRRGRNADGSSRPDFVSAMLLFDIPLFADKRQDRRLAAGREEVMAATYGRADKLRELQRALNDSYARWRLLGERRKLYDTRLLREARLNADASLRAYQSGVSEFTTLMRARLKQLNTQLQALQIRVDQTKVQAQLLYLAKEIR